MAELCCDSQVCAQLSRQLLALAAVMGTMLSPACAEQGTRSGMSPPGHQEAEPRRGAALGHDCPPASCVLKPVS